jgi:hypothetical protein
MLPYLGLGLLALLIWRLTLSKWREMSNQFDKSMWCQQCQAATVHEVTAYRDEQYCQCQVCGRMTRYEIDDEGDLWETGDGEEESQ